MYKTFFSLKYFFAMLYHKTYITAHLKDTLSMLCYAFFVFKQWCLNLQGLYHQNSYLSVFLCWQVYE